MRKEVKKICLNCKTEFTFVAGSKREFKVRRFCNAKCLGAYWKEDYKVRRKGAGNPMYKKKPWNYRGYTYSNSGSRKKYKKLFIKGKYVWEHRWVIEQKIGRKLKRNEVVHHKDHNPLNNSPSNLVIMKPFEHQSYHGKLQGKKYELTK